MRDFSDQLFKFITQNLAGLNLTGIRDADEFYNKLVLDSVAPLKEIPLFHKTIKEAKLVIDIGFGGGFPLLPLAVNLPQVRFLGIEGKKKKVDGVNALIAHLKLSNVSCYHLRLEDILIDCPAVLTFKAVGAVEEILPKIQYLKEVHAFFYKGLGFYEKEDLTKIKKNWQQILIAPYQVPDAGGRILVGFKGKDAHCGKSLEHFQNHTKLSKLL